jgi:hypothetical protein
VSGSRSAWSRAGPKRRLHDEDVPDVDGGTPAEPGDRGKASGPASPELLGVHGHLDAARATL